VPSAGALPAPALAVFDLDGTLTLHDTLAIYAGGFLLRHPQRLVRLVRVLGPLVRFTLGTADQGELKASFIEATLGGRTRSELNGWTDRFVNRLTRQGLRADALSELARHRERGSTLVLLSASPDLYVPAIGRALGFAEVLCTELEWQGERLIGRLITPNRRGTEKARCLQELRSRYRGLPIVAYGDSGSDLEHLRLADRGVLVNGSRRVRRLAAALNISCLDWH